MAYGNTLAERLRSAVAGTTDVEEREMFGGLAILFSGHMACGIVREDLMVRIGPDAYATALARPHVRAMDFTGGPLKGMVYVDPPGIASDKALRAWVDQGIPYARSLPPKEPKPAKKTTADAKVPDKKSRRTGPRFSSFDKLRMRQPPTGTSP